MTDERPAVSGDPIDLAIDRAVREIVAGEAPGDLSARVLARIEQPAPGVWGASGRIAWAAASLAGLVIAAYLAWPSRPAPLVEPEAVVAEARPPAAARAEALPPAEPIAPEPTTPAGGAATPAPARPAEQTVAAALVEPAAFVFRSPREVANLPAPDPIAIDPMPQEAIDVTPVTVEPLAFERLAIEPIVGSR